MTLKNIQIRWFVLAACLAAFIALTFWLIPDTVTPIIIAFSLAYGMSPLIDYLERKRIPRSISILAFLMILMLIFMALLLILIPFMITETREFIAAAPKYIERIIEFLKRLADALSITIPLNKEEIIREIQVNLKKLKPTTLSPILVLIKGAFTNIISVILTGLNLIIVPLFFYYFLKNIHKIQGHLTDMIPPRYKQRALNLFGKINDVISGYIRGQILVALILALIYSVGLSITGIRFGLFIGILAGILNIIPYLGVLIGVVLALLMALVDFAGPWPAIGVLLVFLVGQSLEGLVITPRIVGDKVGLTPLQTIIFLMIGGEIGGIWGMLIAIPLGGVIKVIYKDLRESYIKSDMYAEVSENH